MKILLIHTYYKFKGGEDSVVANEIELLRSQGVEVELLSFNNDHHSLLKLLLLPFNFSTYFKVKEKIISFKPDVVHLHNLHFAGTAAIVYAVSQFKLPLVYTLHNYRLLCPSGTLFHHNKIYMDAVHHDFPWNAVREKVYRNSHVLTFWVAFSMFLHQKLVTWNAVSKFIVLGEHSRQLFVQSKMVAHADRLLVKPNFCYALPVTNVEIERDYYLFVGRLSEEKGILTLLKAFAENGLPLKVVGSGPLSPLVENYALNHFNIVFEGERKKRRSLSIDGGSCGFDFPFNLV